MTAVSDEFNYLDKFKFICHHSNIEFNYLDRICAN